MPNAFVHAELATTDLAKAKDFYGKLFDWKLEESKGADGMAYTMIDVGENEYGVGGGMMATPMPGMPSRWTPYVQVDDAAAATAKARELGGTVHVENAVVAGMGVFSIISDPAGAVFGVWESKQ